MLPFDKGSSAVPVSLAKLLAEAGINPDWLGLYRTGRLPNLPYVLPPFLESWKEWRRFEPIVETCADGLLECAKDPATFFSVARNRLGIVADSVPWAPGSDLRSEIVALGGVPDSELLGLDHAVAVIPNDVATAAAEAISAIHVAVLEVERVFPWRKDLDEPRRAAIVQKALEFARTYALCPIRENLIRYTDLGRLADAAELIARGTEKARALRPLADEFRFEWKSPYGRIVIAGGGGHLHDLQDALFVLDLGKGNHYVGGEPGSRPVTVVVDGGGSQFTDVGPTVFGIEEIFIRSGENRFRSEVSKGDIGGAGGAVFGASLIHCGGGGNEFEAQTLCQGAAVCGFAAVLTDGGCNTYKCYSRAQGFGGVRGIGCLVDTEGGSQYIAEDGFLHNEAPQTPGEHNASLAQGMGFGRRGDPNDRDMAGGFGIVVNGGGGNRFRCGVFGQGAGYLLGIGGVVVRGANNDFEGVWYVQGSAAHYALGSLNVSGDQNRFHALKDQAQGVGVDLALGVLHCVGDHSTFTGGSGRLGMGIANGIGICVVEGDSNRYERPEKGLGFAELDKSRPDLPCFGLFAEGGGTTNASLHWNQHPTPEQPLYGVGTYDPKHVVDSV